MRIITTARHCEIDPEDKLFAERNLEKLSRYATDIREIHLTIGSENYRYTAEIALKVNGDELVAKETANSVRTAVTNAIDRVEHQTRKLKERRVERRRGGRSRATDALAEPGEASGEAGDALGGAAWEE